MRYANRARTFFVEFIVISFFFICISAVIIFTLGKGVQRSHQNEEVMRALLETKNINALIMVSENFEHLKKNLESYGFELQPQGEEQVYRIYYNKDWQIQSELMPGGYEAKIKLESELQDVGTWLESTLEFTRQDREDRIYEVRLDKYYQVRVKE